MQMLLHAAADRRTLGVVFLSLLASCVSKEQYEESQGWAHEYQRQALAAEKRVVELEAENEDLRGRVRSGEIDTLEASTGGLDPSLEARLGDLKSQLNDLGRPPGDIERFDVDGGYVLMIQDKVLFASGSYEIGAEGRAALLNLAKEIDGTPHGRIMVRGHTDNVPVVKPETLKRLPHGNLQLSAMRAVAVGALLIREGGLSGSDVVVAGFGEWEPIAANDSADNKRLNRRVEIFVEERK